MKPRARVITGAADLDGLSLVSGPRQVKFHPPVADAEDASQWQTRLNRALSRCGCTEGGVAMALALPVAALWAGWLAPEGAGADHLKALARIARVMREPEKVKKLRETSNANAIYSLLTESPASNAA